MIPNCVEFILNCYSDLLSIQTTDCEDIGRLCPIPFFEEPLLMDLCHASVESFKDQTSLIALHAPIYVIGDIHGNIFDLVRIFIHSTPPPKSRFLFLGDYVDRGQFSVEVITLLLAFQIRYPEHVFLIRGNHEFECVNSFYGFKDECLKHYSKALYEEFNTVFSYFPIAAIINNAIFCVHGGLSPQLTSINQFDQLKLPLKTYETDFVADLVWSDPSADNPMYIRSNRGSGVTFGKEAIELFMEAFNMKSILRAHQCVQQGISKFDKYNVYTVFSCSNYAEASQNRCGIIFLNDQLQLKGFSLPPLEQIDRKSTNIEVKPTPINFIKEVSPVKTISQKIYELKNYFKNGFQKAFNDKQIPSRLPVSKVALPKLT